MRINFEDKQTKVLSPSLNVEVYDLLHKREFYSDISIPVDNQTFNKILNLIYEHLEKTTYYSDGDKIFGNFGRVIGGKKCIIAKGHFYIYDKHDKLIFEDNVTKSTWIRATINDDHFDYYTFMKDGEIIDDIRYSNGIDDDMYTEWR